jgi:hypothetical protein
MHARTVDRILSADVSPVVILWFGGTAVGCATPPTHESSDAAAFYQRLILPLCVSSRFLRSLRSLRQLLNNERQILVSESAAAVLVQVMEPVHQWLHVHFPVELLSAHFCANGDDHADDELQLAHIVGVVGVQSRYQVLTELRLKSLRVLYISAAGRKDKIHRVDPKFVSRPSSLTGNPYIRAL